MSRKKHDYREQKKKYNKDSYLARKQAELDEEIKHDKYVNPTKKPLGKILIVVLTLAMLLSGLVSLILLILNNAGVIHLG